MRKKTPSKQAPRSNSKAAPRHTAAKKAAKPTRRPASRRVTKTAKKLLRTRAAKPAKSTKNLKARLSPAPTAPRTTTPELTAREVIRGQARGQARAFAIEAARMLNDDRCEDVVVLELGGVSQLCDYVVIGTGTSDRQMWGTAQDIEKMGNSMNFQLTGRNIDDRATWVLLDFTDVIIHLFEPNTRAFYDLEMLWGDASKIDWARPAGSPPPGRGRRAFATAEESSEANQAAEA